MLSVKANLCDGNSIVIRCQQNHTDLSVADMYVKRLRIYFTNVRDDTVALFHDVKPSHQIINEFHSETIGNVIHYTFNITVNPKLNRSIITCGAGYPYQGRKKYCYTASAALIFLQACVTNTTETPVTPVSNTSPTTPKVITTTETPVTNASQITPKVTTTETSVTPVFTTSPTTPKANTTNETPVTPVSNTSETTPKVNSDGIILNKEEFFPVVGIAILVGVALLVANVIQLWVIVRNRRTATRTTVDSVSATNDIALQLELGTETEYDVDSKTHGGESEDVSNSAVTGSG